VTSFMFIVQGRSIIPIANVIPLLLLFLFFIMGLEFMAYTLSISISPFCDGFLF
jgi:hypothetical protein